MDTFSELESFATETTHEDVSNDPLSSEAISQYMDLFGLDEHGAIAKIRELRGLFPQRDSKPQHTRAAAYLVKLQEHVPTAEALQVIANLTEAPEVIIGTDDSGRESQFCRVDGQTRTAIAMYFANNHPGNAPTFLQLTRAAKSLSRISVAPMMGLDATMPQNRPESGHMEFRPRQDEYPVWYFLYGPLADADELAIILRLADEPEYKPAVVYGARMLSTNAVVDGESQSHVVGEALCVRTEKDEESLRFSVTDKFEVVRCKMSLVDTGEMIIGLTFRYIGGDM